MQPTDDLRLGTDAASAAAAPERERVAFTFAGRRFEGLAGEPIAIALWAAGVRRLRQAPATGAARGLYCGVGHCYECRVTVNGVAGVRACLTPLRAGMQVEPGDAL